MSTIATSKGPFSGLAAALPKKVVLPSDDGWDAARQSWQLLVDQRPAAIVFPESAEDVVQVVLFARQQGYRVAAQRTGHNAAPMGGLSDTILVKTDRMRGVVIDPAAQTARLEAGVRAADLVEAAARHGLAALTGTYPAVGVVGYTLGGGMGVFGRRYGLTCNHVRAVELVTASGQLVRADRDHEPELFWALRGGGGSFGVVTALELALLPLTHAYAGTLWYPSARAHEVLHAWRELTQATPPDALTTIGRLMSFPPIPEVHEAVRGKSFVVVHVYHAGDAAEADRLLAPLRALGPVNDTIQTVTMPALGEVKMDPDGPNPGVGDGLMLAELPADGLKALLDVAGPDSGSPVGSVDVRHLEGEFARARPKSGATASIPAKYAVYLAGNGPTPELEASLQGHIAAIKQALAPWTTPYMFLTYADTPRDPGSFWTEPAYQRLRRIKTLVDPANLIRANHPVPPEG
jgi:FAD/FMN-containing dehydrogenase